jgi:hypothetical protein
LPTELAVRRRDSTAAVVEVARTALVGSLAMSESAPDERLRGRVRSRLAAVPRVLWLIVTLQVFVMLCATLLYPAFQEPDEALHVDYVLAHRHGDWFTDPGTRWPQIGVLDAYGSMPTIQTGQHLGDLTPPPRASRKSFDADSTQLAPPATPPNQMTQHPFGYYGLAAAWSYLLPNFSHQRWDIQVLWLRLLSILLLAPVPLLIYYASKRVTGSHTASMVAAIVPAAIPSYLRTGASVTNDVLLTLLGMLLLYELCKVLTGDLRRSTSLRVGLWWGLMLLTKGIALILPPMIVLAYLVGASSRFGDRSSENDPSLWQKLWGRVRIAFLPCVIAGAVGSVLGGWWWVRNVVKFGTVQPSGRGPNWPATRLYGSNTSGTNESLVTAYLRTFSRHLFGSLGLIDRPGWPENLLIVLFIVFVALVAAGVVIGLRRALAPRWAAFTLVLPALLFTVFALVQIRKTYLQTHVLAGVQARYLDAFIGGLAIVGAVALTVALRRFSRWLVLAVFTAITLFQCANVLLLLEQQYGSTLGSRAHKIGKGVEFLLKASPFPNAVSVLIVVITAAVTIATFVVLLRTALAAAPRPAFAGVDQASATSPSSAGDASHGADGSTRTV